ETTVPFVPPTAEQLGLYLGLDEIQGDRADLLIATAIGLCQTVVKPLPEGAEAVVLSVAGRAYVNPQQVSYETTGRMSVQRRRGSSTTTASSLRTSRKAGIPDACPLPVWGDRADRPDGRFTRPGPARPAPPGRRRVVRPDRVCGHAAGADSAGGRQPAAGPG